MNDSSVVFFGNRDLGLRILRHLVSVGDAPRVVVLEPRGTSPWADQLWSLADSINAIVVRSDELERDEALKTVESVVPSIGVSAYFSRILGAKMLGLFPRGILNCHGSLLPWNRGRDPNAWAIYDGTPAGGTIHLMDSGVDTGPILLQQEVPVTPDMDAAELYLRTVDVIVRLFEEHWPLLKQGLIAARNQEAGGPSHARRDFERLRHLDLTRELTLGKAITLLRGCSMSEEIAAEFVDGETRYSVRVSVKVVGRLGGPGW